MRVIIAGSRGVTDLGLVEKAILNSGFNITEVVSGGARGPDKLGECWAIENGVKWTRFPANWDLWGRRAGPIRNEEMAVYTANWQADGEDGGALIAIWDLASNGTRDMISRAERHGLQVYIEAAN